MALISKNVTCRKLNKLSYEVFPYPRFQSSRQPFAEEILVQLLGCKNASESLLNPEEQVSTLQE